MVRFICRVADAGADGSTFCTTKQNVSLHVRNLFREGALREDAVVKEFLTTAADGKNAEVVG